MTPDWFDDPEPRFRTATFWFWHRIPTDAEIAAQLSDMRKTGIGRVMIQARPALGLDLYLSPAYLAAYRTACAEAHRLGLGVTIYDEYGWMSGHGGGRTVAGADHLRERHLFWTSGPADAPLTVSGIRSPFHEFLGDVGREWIYEGGLPRWGDWGPVLVLAHPETIGSARDIDVVDGTVRVEGTSTGCTVVVDGAPAGSVVTAFVAGRCLTSRLINYLLPEAVERFAEQVYAPLLAAAGDAADAVFFDHPYAGFYVWNEHFGALGNSLLWDGTPADPATLVSLLRSVGPGTAALRSAYLAAYAERMHAAFFGTLSRWATERSLAFTGHELLPHVGGWALNGGITGFDPRTMPGLDHFGLDAYRTETVVDAEGTLPQLAAKLGDSVARANGRTRCTVEQYFTGRETGMPALAGQWGLTAERFRAQAIRHLLLGARRIVLHAVSVTDGWDGDGWDGDARPMANPRFDFPPAFNFEPWWEDCPAIFDELARLSAFLEDGDPVRPVALLYPLATLRIEGPGHPCASLFGRWAEALATSGIGYDVVDERTLASALAAGTRYGTLVLPAVDALGSPASAGVIAGFADRGGRVVASGTGSRAWASDALRVGAASETIAGVVASLARPDPAIRFDDDGPTWCSAARCGDVWRVVVLNDAAATRSLSIQTGAAASEVTRWHPATGDVADDHTAVSGDLHFRVEPQQLLCLTLRPTSRDRTPLVATVPAEREAVRLAPSTVLASGWTLEIDGRPRIPIDVDRGWERQGFAAFSGTGTYRRTLDLPAPLADVAWHLVLPEVHETAECVVAGRSVGRHVGGEARFALPPSLFGEVEVELRVRNTAANRYYRGTSFAGERRFASGLTRPPQLVASRS